MQDKWLEEWNKTDRRWEIWIGDAVAASLTCNIQSQCWGKGYVSVTHGGGASMIAQTNDTEEHKPIRADLTDLQQTMLLDKTRLQGGGLVDLTDEEIITSVAHVMANKHIRLLGCKGYKYTGTTNKFDGTEDGMICKDARKCWDELGMRRMIDDAVANLEKR